MGCNIRSSNSIKKRHHAFTFLKDWLRHSHMHGIVKFIIVNRSTRLGFAGVCDVIAWLRQLLARFTGSKRIKIIHTSAFKLRPTISSYIEIVIFNAHSFIIFVHFWIRTSVRLWFFVRLFQLVCLIGYAMALRNQNQCNGRKQIPPQRQVDTWWRIDREGICISIWVSN